MSALPGLSVFGKIRKKRRDLFARHAAKDRARQLLRAWERTWPRALAVRSARRHGAFVQLGRSAACVHGELRRLATTRFITLNAGSRGTLITVART